MPLVAPGVATNHAPIAPSLFKMTGEQEAIVTAAKDESNPTIAEALAGTGKTSTLVEIAKSMPRRPMTYLAFNKSVALEAQRKFPTWVNVATAHSFAYQAVGKAYSHRLPGNGSRRISAQQMARMLKVRPAQLDTGTLNPVLITRAAQATVNRYLRTADASISHQHIPGRVIGQHSPKEIAELVLPVADRIWSDLQSTTGEFYFTHDVYLKLWQLRGGTFPGEVVMFDEAQDADPVTAAIVNRHQGKRIYVGDRNQAIYGWRGAIDAMSRIEGATRLPLTRSFRFGPAIADAANAWLEQLGSHLRVVGHDPIQSEVRALREGERPRAILCRGNGTALGWVIHFQKHGTRVALAPGDRNAGKDISNFAWAAKDLMDGNGTSHPDLVGFQTWDELVKFVEEEEQADDLKRLVNIITRVGISGVIDAVKGLVTEDRAEVTVSTAHKAKGLEWDVVQVADDFTAPEDEDEIDQEDLAADRMLAYVTVTRAKRVLAPGALGEPGLWDL